MQAIWRSVHVYYYAEAKDQLLLQAIRPLITQLEPRVERIYFVRHWRQGPHVRIPILASSEALASHVEGALGEHVASYLAAHPSRQVLPEERKLLAAHERLAVLEQERGPLRPLAADNTISVEEHDRRSQLLGGEAGAELLADFYSATNHLAFRMLEAIEAGVSRDALSLSLMLAVAHCFCGQPPSLAKGFISFRSHAEAFLHQVADPERTRASFEEQYRVRRLPLQRLVAAVLDALDRGSRELPFVVEWVDALRPFYRRAQALVRSGEIQLPSAPPAAEVARLTTSPMHRLMAESPALRRMLYEDKEFYSYRLALNYTYLHMARLGVMGYARYRLGHLAANAVEELLGLSAQEIVLQAAGAIS